MYSLLVTKRLLSGVKPGCTQPSRCYQRADNITPDKRSYRKLSVLLPITGIKIVLTTAGQAGFVALSSSALT